MGLLSTCCCCCNVRTGSLVIAVYTLILSCLEVTLNLLLVVFGFYTPVGFICLVTCVVIFGILVITSVLLLIGIVKDIVVLLLPWMFCIVLTVVSILVVVIALLASMGFSIFTLVYLGVWIVTGCFNIYGLLIVISQYQELKAGRGTALYYKRATNDSTNAQSKQRGLTEQAEGSQVYQEKPSSTTNTQV
ncbi:lysosomal-associated transmembrane protein 5-like [Ptychodera flava]|uniref:lysosomal-associated transmembrane protein 5-like n=1 Tax=Ptychodera flava TaxID=63121 RepID=UPI003969E46D